MNLGLGLFFLREFLESVDNFVGQIAIRFRNYRIGCRYNHRDAFVTAFSDSRFQWNLNRLNRNSIKNRLITKDDKTVTEINWVTSQVTYLAKKLQTHLVGCSPSATLSKNEGRFTAMGTLEPAHVLYNSQNLQNNHSFLTYHLEE